MSTLVTDAARAAPDADSAATAPHPFKTASGGTRQHRKQIRRLAVAALMEAVTLILLLFVAVPLKHLAGWPAAVTTLGPVHGFAFLSFMWIAIETTAAGDCSRRELARMVVMACIPFGGFTSFVFLRRKLP